MRMPQELLAYLSGEVTDEDLSAFRALVVGLESTRLWTYGPPQFVDETDATSCTRPEDSPIRTVGVVLVVSSPGEVPETPVAEAGDLIEFLSQYSADREQDFVLQLDNTYVGEIRNGVADTLVREGLLERW